MSAEKRRGDTGGDALEHEFRAMFAERSETVRPTAAPYAAVRRRIAETRRKRRMRIGGAGVAFAVAVAGIGVWAAGPGRDRGAAPATTPPVVGTPPNLVYSDGHTPLPAGPLHDVALNWLRARYGRDLSGLTVVTTFDLGIQTVADAKASPDDAGVAVLDSRNGDVLALGGTWDRPIQIADLMKPVELAAAFQTGRYTPQSTEPLDTQKHPLYWPPGAAAPLTYFSDRQRYWPPESSTATITDTAITLAQAAASDVNGPFAQLEVGSGMSLPAIIDLAVGMGMPQDSQNLLRVPSVVLGAPSATPLTMAGVYATIADGGVHRDPRMVEKVLGKDGRALWTPAETTTRVLSQNTATELAGVLHMALISGTTGTAAETRAGAGSGTWAMAAAADMGHSAWFDGADSHYVITVGLSKTNADGSFAPLSGAARSGSGAFGPSVGSRLAGPVWARVVQALRTHG